MSHENRKTIRSSMRVKDFYRQVMPYDKPFHLYEKRYSRDSEEYVSIHPINSFGLNASGQLVLEVDYSRTKPAMVIGDLFHHLRYVSPELKMFMMPQWETRGIDTHEVSLIECTWDQNEWRMYLTDWWCLSELRQYQYNEVVKKHNL